ncbi:MAG: hypothetical protein ABSB87_00800 [Terriglobales bacterium]
MKRALILVVFLLPSSLAWLSCGGGSGSGSHVSGIAYRAFISNNVSAGTSASGVYIVNAQNDVRGPATPISAGSFPGMMVVTPNRTQTLVFSGNGTQESDNLFSIITNSTEKSTYHLTLPGMTQSFVVSPDSSTTYIAVPTAQVLGQPPGLVGVVSLLNGTFEGQAAVPAVQYLSINNSGSLILGFSANSDSVAVITPSQIGIGNAVTYIGGPGIFDRPVGAFFSTDDSTAYVVSCGAECGGTQASVQQYNLVTNQLVASVPACIPNPGSNPVACQGPAAGSVALLNGSTMYLAGTPYTPGGGESLTCPAGTTQAQYCGQLTILNLSTMSVTNTSEIIITDGYHNRIALGPNGQLFIGAHTCTEIIPPVPPPPGAEVRGCLSIYNTLTNSVGTVPPGGVIVPPANGDVTGIQPINTQRAANSPPAVVYLVQGGSLNIYDVTKDALEYNPNNPENPGEVRGLIGYFFDVKTVDF